MTAPTTAAAPSTTSPDAAPLPRPPLRAPVLVALAAALAGAVVVATGVGAYPVAPGRVLALLLDAAGVWTLDEVDATARAVVVDVRLPRVLLAALVGAGLATAGTVLQGVFRNPLAEPGVVGVSAGAAVGAVLAILLGVGAAGLGVPLAAFVGGLATTLLVWSVARRDGRTETVTLVLSGIAVNAIAGAVIGLALFLSDDAQLRSITFWNLGSVGAATWRAVALTGPVLLVGVVLAPRLAGSLDLLSLGEGPARHLGVDVERLRLRAVVLVAALTAAGVAVAGIVSFVGLVVPHLIRLRTGPGHRLLVPASALGGALLLVLGDLVARTVAAPAEVPLGVLTGLLGGPFFFWLLLRARDRAGGWA